MIEPSLPASEVCLLSDALLVDPRTFPEASGCGNRQPTSGSDSRTMSVADYNARRMARLAEMQAIDAERRQSSRTVLHGRRRCGKQSDDDVLFMSCRDLSILLRKRA